MLTTVYIKFKIIKDELIKINSIVNKPLIERKLIIIKTKLKKVILAINIL
ncbi:hypothetical protein GCM10022396_06260 [Flavivirga amylovorans]